MLTPLTLRVKQSRTLKASGKGIHSPHLHKWLYSALSDKKAGIRSVQVGKRGWEAESTLWGWGVGSATSLASLIITSCLWSHMPVFQSLTSPHLWEELLYVCPHSHLLFRPSCSPLPKFHLSHSGPLPTALAVMAMPSVVSHCSPSLSPLWHSGPLNVGQHFFKGTRWSTYSYHTHSDQIYWVFLDFFKQMSLRMHVMCPFLEWNLPRDLNNLLEHILCVRESLWPGHRSTTKHTTVSANLKNLLI